MRKEPVEVYSDTTNAAIMRHPDRHFPGVLIQGDSLSALCRQADQACKLVCRETELFEELNDLRNSLRAYLTHYKAVLGEHGMPLPFSE